MCVLKLIEREFYLSCASGLIQDFRLVAGDISNEIGYSIYSSSSWFSSNLIIIINKIGTRFRLLQTVKFILSFTRTWDSFS